MKEQFKAFQNIHLALCIGVSLAYVLVGELYQPENLGIPEITPESTPFLLLPIVAIILSEFLFKSQLKKIDKSLALEQNLGAYQTALLIRWAILEGAAFLILFMKPEFIVLGMVLIVYMAFLRPTEAKLHTDLGKTL